MANCRLCNEAFVAYGTGVFAGLCLVCAENADLGVIAELESAQRDNQLLREQLEWERDPSGVMLRAGHDKQCDRVRRPRAAFACNHETIRNRRGTERGFLEANRCINEMGSVTGSVLPTAWLAPGIRRRCDICQITYTANSFRVSGHT